MNQSAKPRAVAGAGLAHPLGLYFRGGSTFPAAPAETSAMATDARPFTIDDELAAAERDVRRR